MAGLSLNDLTEDPYAALGLRRFINATCHHTKFGGTLISDRVLDAMRSAAAGYVDMTELQKAAGRIIAEYTHAESGYVVSGCAAAMMVGTAAVLTGTDPVKMQRLPHLEGTGMKDRVAGKRFPRRIAPDGREYVHYGYAHAVKTAGVEFDEVGHDGTATLEELEAALGTRTAMVYWGTHEAPGDIPVEQVIEVAHRSGVPVLIDNSNHLPPREHLWRYIDAGADLVTYSGGKGFQGPQGAGILAGRANLIDAVALQAAPTQGIGRVCKVSKEEVIGQLAALLWWAEQDDEERMTEFMEKTQRLVDGTADIRGTRAELQFPDDAGRPYATALLHLSEDSGLTAADIIEQLHEGEPPIAAMTSNVSPDTVVRFDVRLCEDWEIDAIATRLKEILG